MIFSKWKHSQSVRVGVDHTENNLPCQDNVFYRKGNGIHVLALSDGAGSKKYSQIGSEAATKNVCDYIIEEFDALYAISETYGKSQSEIEDSKRIIRDSIFNHIKKELLEKVEGEINFDDLACTLLFVAIKGDKYIMGHIGDGVIGGLFNGGKDETLRVLSHPENGNQINITFFLTDPDAVDHFKVQCGKFVNLTGIILMSDGPEEVLYHPINGLHINCLKLFHNFNNHSSEVYNNILGKFLSVQVAKYSYDDLSINMLFLATADSRESSQEVLNDMFLDITNNKQIIRKSSYGLFLDNSREYEGRDDMSRFRGETR